MYRRLLIAALAICACASSAPIAKAGTSDINNITLTESFSYLSTSQYHISTGGSLVQFRWLDAPGKDTIISANSCYDLSENGRSSYAAGSTSYHSLFSGFQNQCFYLRGRTATGQGAMANAHDGRVSR